MEPHDLWGSDPIANKSNHTRSRMALLIDIGTALYHTGVRLAAPFVPKAKQWVEGRKGLWERLEERSKELHGCLWMHCASVGEFEQGRPVLEAIKAERPDLPVLLTFFSPSGYEAWKEFPLATHVEYLPPDSAANAARLLELIRPKAALFVKYEFWYRHLMALEKARIPTFLVSAIFRPTQPFFKWYGGSHRAMLRSFTHTFVQEARSLELLKGIGVDAVSVSGDTRFDRVAAIASTSTLLPIAEAFRKASERPVLVVGSSWPADEALIIEALSTLLEQPRIMIAPHELDTSKLDAIAEAFPRPVVRWSVVETELEQKKPVASTMHLPPEEDALNARTLLVDRMGLLSRLYRCGDIAYVGGGFGSGIHSLLEAAAWGKPVIFGPRHTKFAEAKGLIEARGGFEVRNAAELRTLLLQLLTDPSHLKATSEAAKNYVVERTGATDLVVQKVLPLIN